MKHGYFRFFRQTMEGFLTQVCTANSRPSASLASVKQPIITIPIIMPSSPITPFSYLWYFMAAHKIDAFLVLKLIKTQLIDNKVVFASSDAGPLTVARPLPAASCFLFTDWPARNSQSLLTRRGSCKSPQSIILQSSSPGSVWRPSLSDTETRKPTCRQQAAIKILENMFLR